MSIQRVNFESLNNGGDNPSNALRKLDGNCNDLQNQINDVKSDSAFGSGLNIPHGSVTIGSPDGEEESLTVNSSVTGYHAIRADSYTNENTHGYINRGGVISSRLPNRGSPDDPFALNIFVEEVAGDFVQAGLELRFDGNHQFNFRNDNNAYATGNWISTSDRRIKKNFVKIEDALDKVAELTGYDCEKLGNRVSTLIAQDIQKVLPRAILVYGDMTLQDGSVVQNVLAVDNSAVTALLVNAINELSAKVADLQNKLDVTREMV